MYVKVGGGVDGWCLARLLHMSSPDRALQLYICRRVFDFLAARLSVQDVSTTAQELNKGPKFSYAYATAAKETSVTARVCRRPAVCQRSGTKRDAAHGILLVGAAAVACTGVFMLID
jgi:hypothetical protein